MKFNTISRAAVAVALVAAASSCHIYKSYSTPTDSALTRAYVEARQQPVDSTSFGNLLWENVFTDPKLATLIQRALENNNNLENAKLNVDIARANVLGARLSYLPSVAFAPSRTGSSVAGSDLHWTYNLPAQVSWEVDIFGKILNSKRGAKAALMQSEDYAQAVRSQIISAVASTYYSIAAVRCQLELSRNTSVLWKQTVETMKELKEAGRGVTEAAVVQSAANYYNILGSITDLEVNLDKLYNTMSLLLDTMPQEWDVTDNVDLTVPEIGVSGIPMAELAWRPDVHAAEMSLAAAYYTTNSARAAFYPSININFTGGYTDPGNWFYQLAGSLTAPLFARGQNIARLKAAKAQQMQALNNFEYKLMSAAAEVSDALTVYHKSIEKSGFLKEQVANLKKSVEYTNDLMLYSTGSTSYLEVLTAQQTLLQAQIGQITTDLARANAVINLYQSLGGGR